MMGCPSLPMRKSFVSNQDFRMSTDEDVLNDSRLLTPKAMKSRTTSMGNPEHEKAKNCRAPLALNDSISSN
jgi:hypothetical protein